MLLMMVSVAVPNIVTQGRREKEKEMIWRGNQYVRGVRLYYQKTRRFPMQLEDLYQPKMGIRFMRQPYKDPMNNADGSWRLICVGPSGQIIGSLRKQTNPFFFGAPAPPNFAGALSPTSSPSGFPNSSFPNSSPSSSSVGSSPPAAQIDPQNSSNSNLASPSNTFAAPFTPQGPGSSDASKGFEDSPIPSQTIIIGVGSKIDKKSVIWYEGEKNYLQFEFVWKGTTAASGTPSP